MKRGAGAVLLFTIISPPVSQAQEVERVSPGDRVRVTAPGCSLDAKKPRFSSLSGDTLWISTETKEVGCATSEITMLEVFRPTRIWKTSAIGFLAGGAAGVLVTAVIDSQMGRVPFTNRRWVDATDYLTGGLVGGAIGTVTGMSIGKRQSFGGWKEIPLPLIQPSLFVSRGGCLNLGISIPLRR